MIVVIGALMLVTLLSAAALATAGGDMRSTGYATGQKQAYEAADAGLNWFEAQLGQDPNYWQKCTSVPQVGTPASAAPVNNAWNGTGSDPRVWRGVDGNPSPSPTQSAYTIELLPATPGTPCSTADPAGTMITSSGTFRIRVTGRGNANGARRSVVATFRRRGFLDYLWYTDFETSDPTIAPMTHGYTSSNPPFDQWAADPVNGCAKHFYEGRASNGYSGTVNGTQVTNVRCAEIQFVTGDTMAGPMHSNDSLL
ncbi:MAG TPA: hypothetical protein VKJ07_19375, partial [Mycobacteriales bacterium]|nr:hypothetical protein [Mycobacteriales bacterium]